MDDIDMRRAVGDTRDRRESPGDFYSAIEACYVIGISHDDDML